MINSFRNVLHLVKKIIKHWLKISLPDCDSIWLLSDVQFRSSLKQTIYVLFNKKPTKSQFEK